MKNFEYFEKEIKEISVCDTNIALVGGVLKPCRSTKCDTCEFENNNHCHIARTNWLYKEYVEKPKISKRTKAFFDSIETGWVARDDDGTIHLTIKEPQKVSNSGIWVGRDCVSLCIQGRYCVYAFDFLTLDFIKWEDEKPWSVEDIRKLEVLDE